MRKVKTGPQVLVWKGKHSDVYWDATDELGAFLAMFECLDENDTYYELHGEGWKDTQDAISELKKDSEKISAALATLPESLISEAEGKLKRNENDLKEYGLQEEHRGLYLKAKAGDGEAARRLIWTRADGEYEGYSLETLNPPVKVKAAAGLS